MSYYPNNPNGEATMANSAPVVIASNQTAVPVSSSTLATAAKQDTGNTSVASIDTKIPALGQALAAASVPVVLTAAQITTLTPPAAITGFATSAKQDTIIGHVDGIEGLLTTIDGDTGTIAGAVAGSEMQVDVVTSALPSGASTLAEQQSQTTHLATIAGDTTDIEAAVELIDDTVATLGTTTYTEAATKGLIIGAVRRDADTTLVDTTNEVGPLQMNAAGQLKTEVFSGETLPVSLTSTTITGTVAVTQSGTWDEVGINDSGNSITVDNGGTFAVQVDGAALTSLQLIDDPIATDDTTTHSTGSTKVMGVGFVADPTDSTVNANDIGMPAMNTSRFLKVIAQANSGVDIGDVDITSIAAGDNNIGNVDIVTMPNVTLAAGTNTNEVVGDVAHDTAVGGNPLLNGAEARDTLGTAVATGDVVRMAANRYGALLTTAYPTSHASSNGTPITATTTSVIAAPSASSHLRVVRFTLSNGGSTATWVGIRDGAAGTQHYRVYLVQGSVVSLNLNKTGPLDLTTATRLDLVLSAAGSVEYEIDYLTVAD